MHRCEKACDSLQAIKACNAEWDDRRERSAIRRWAEPQELQTLRFAEIIQIVGAFLIHMRGGSRKERLMLTFGCQDRRRWCEDYDAGVLLRQPED